MKVRTNEKSHKQGLTSSEVLTIGSPIPNLLLLRALINYKNKQYVCHICHTMSLAHSVTIKGRYSGVNVEQTLLSVILTVSSSAKDPFIPIRFYNSSRNNF